MDVVANAGTVRGGVVVTEDLEALRELANRHLGKERKEVSRPSPRVLTDQARGVRSGGVEVPQSDGAPLVGRRVGNVLDDEFRHELCAAVDGLGLEGGGLGDGDGGGGAVNGRRGRVDDVVDAVTVHDLRVSVRVSTNEKGKRGGRGKTHVEEVDRRGNVVLVVLDRDLTTLSHRLERGNVDNTPDRSPPLLVVDKDLVNLGLDRDVAANDLDLEGLLVLLGGASGEGILRNLGDALEGRRERVGEAASGRGDIAW